MVEPMATDVVVLATELLSIPSPTGHEGEVVDYISRWLIGREWNVTMQEVTPGRNNLWATRAKSTSPGLVTLSTHLDTVPPFIPPRLVDDRLFGRGACDAKGIAAAMLTAADRLAANGEERVGLLFVVGEEKGSDGAIAANRLGNRSRHLINGEPTENRLATGAKGSLRVSVITEGREAHSAYPELGSSAIEPLLALLPALRTLSLPSDPVLGPTTINVGVIQGGTEANIIPGRGRAELMVRVVGGVDKVRAALEDWANGVARLEYGPYIPPQYFGTMPGFPSGPVAYTSDIPLLNRWGKPLLFGPGSIRFAHTPDEHIDLADLRASIDVYERLVRMLLDT
jgi:acetylornithine deacetylase